MLLNLDWSIAVKILLEAGFKDKRARFAVVISINLIPHKHLLPLDFSEYKNAVPQKGEEVFFKFSQSYFT